MGVDDLSTLDAWLVEENTYLQGLTKEPDEETLEMEYYSTLLIYRDLE